MVHKSINETLTINNLTEQIRSADVINYRTLSPKEADKLLNESVSNKDLSLAIKLGDGSYIDSFRSRRGYINFGGDYYYRLSNETPNIIN